jgi:hypothetical protein
MKTLELLRGPGRAPVGFGREISLICLEPDARD